MNDDAVRAIPGIEPSFSQPIRDNVLESISQIDGQIVIKVFGDDIDMLRQTSASDVLEAISPVRGVARAFIDRAGQVPQLQIEIDRARAARYGLNVADVRGRDRNRARRQGRPPRSGRASASSPSWSGCARTSGATSQSIGNDPGRHAARARGCRWRMSPTLSDRQRQHEHRARSRQAPGRDRRVHRGPRHGQRRRRDAAARARGACTLPPGYFVQWGGEFENQQRAMARLELDRADQHLADLPAAVQRLRIGEERRADSAPTCRSRWSAAFWRCYLTGIPSERFGRHRLHRAVRAGGAERRGDRELLQRAAREGRRARTKPRSKARWCGSARC